MAGDTENKNIELNLDFEKIVPWNGQQDTGRDVRMKLDRNWKKVADAFNIVLNYISTAGLDNKFLRKDQPDAAQEIITFLKGLVIGENGSGVTVLEDGTSQAVVDRLYVKMKAVFDSLEIKRKTFVGGEQILSPAGMKCIRVETLQNVYRCYMKAEEDGIQIDHEFVEGQLAICQECNIKVGVAQHQGNRFYWREVVAVGPDYIDLSINPCAGNSDVPAEGDDIIGLGHRTDIVRQSAIIMSSVADTAPSIIFYQGIDDFTLDGKEVIALEYDRSSGHAKVRIYGSTYIGDKDGESYMSYDPKKGLEIKAKKILMGSGESLDDTIERMAENVTNVATQLDGSLEIWQGDYASTDEYMLAERVAPSNEWDTDSKKNEHLGDYLVLTNGTCYEFQYDEEESRYIWSNVTDQYLIAYLRTLDTKKAVFKITDDSLPLGFFGQKAYNVGDLWVNAVYPESGEIYDDETLVCITPKSAGEQFDITHWTPADGTKKKLLEAGIDINTREIAFTAEQFKFKNLLGRLFAVLEEVDGVPTIRAELLNITGQLIAEKILASGLDIGGKFVVTIHEDGTASVKLSGVMESASTGRRILIDPESQTLKMFTESGKETVIMRFDTTDDGWDYGDLILNKYVDDQLVLTTEVYPERIHLKDHVRTTDCYLSPESVTFLGRGGESISVGVRPIYDGLTISKYVASISSDSWPLYNSVGTGGVYLDGDTLKVKT